MTCHSTPSGGVADQAMPEGQLRTGATPKGNPTPLSGGYFALFSSAAPSSAKKQGEVAANLTKIQIQFPGYKNSSICVPCHAGTTFEFESA